MDAMVMAGGKGSRLNMGEKPMATLLGRHLLDYVVSAVADSSIDNIFVATTPNVPTTRGWARERGLFVVETPGKGYVSDMIYAVQYARIKEPLLFIMADLPLTTGSVIDQVIGMYEKRPEPALSVHTPLSLHRKLGRKPESLFNYNGQLIVPVGLNILDGSEIEFEQEDFHMILERIELAVNVNTPEDLLLCESMIKKSKMAGDRDEIHG